MAQPVKISALREGISKIRSYENELYLAWGLLLILSLIWGSSFILIKKGLVALAPGEVGSLRIFSASLFLLPFAVKQLKGLSRRQLVLLLVSGLMGSFFPAFLFAIAQTRLNSSMTGILNALTPLFVLIAGGTIFKQTITKNQSIGLLIGFAGTAILVVANSDGNIGAVNFYAFLVILATFLYGNNLNLIKFYLSELKPIAISSVSMFLIGPLSAVYLFLGTGFVEKLQNVEGVWMSVLAVITLGMAGTALALILFNKLVKITNPVFTSSVTYLIPIVAVMWGVIDGETLGLSHFAGMAAIIFGVLLANKKKKLSS